MTPEINLKNLLYRGRWFLNRDRLGFAEPEPTVLEVVEGIRGGEFASSSRSRTQLSRLREIVASTSSSSSESQTLVHRSLL